MSYEVERLSVPRDVPMPRTAGDWELYSSMPGVEAIADKMSGALRKLIRTTPPDDLLAGWEAFSEVMDRYANFGASDTEPRNVALRVLDTVYGPEVVRRTLG